MIRVIARKDVLEKYGLDEQDFMTAVAVSFDIKIEIPKDRLKKLVMNFILEEDGRLIRSGVDKLRRIICESDDGLRDIDDYHDLAVQLREYWPSGKKNDIYPWTESVENTIFRLQLFERRYGRFDDMDILDVALDYVNSYVDDDTYLMTLKNFIMREQYTADGYRFDSKLHNLLTEAGKKPISSN